MTLEKLPAIRGDLVRNDPGWETWCFIKLPVTEALKLWTCRNPIESTKERPNRNFQTQQREGKRTCMYCYTNDHKLLECTAVISLEKPKGILMRKKLCFNCTGPYHRSAECKSITTCQHCKKRYHPLHWYKTKGLKPEGVMPAHLHSGEGVIYPVVLIEIDGIKTHALLDTGAVSSP